MGALLDTKEVEDVLDLVRDLADQLKNAIGDGNYSDKQRQLKAVCQSIQKLETHKVTVPDELRSLKATLIAEISAIEENESTLNALRTGLSKILDDLNALCRDVPAPRMRRDKTNFSYTLPTMVNLDGYPEIAVNSWRDLLEQVLNTLLSTHPDKVQKIESSRGGKRRLFSRSPSDFRAAVKLQSGLYVEGSRSANSIYSFIRKVMVLCGESPDGLNIEVERKS